MTEGKTSSIFNTPCRQAVYAENHTKAIEENKANLGASLSPLSYVICGKIREIHDVIDALCLAITGGIGLESGSETISELPMEDKRGMKMQMVYGKLNEHNKINENNEKTYNKLVRDKIPEIIKADGRQCDILIAAGDEKYKLLEAKLVEEVNEFLEDKNLEELADVMEVLFGLAESLGYSEEELLKARAKKLKERGGFKDGIVIKTVR
ncbi:putative house-cleaning noncanonical NTP pyrophosphatase (MazG superfamily) [Clostridium beijerinckii]|nr:putative house-cleaning noncanonical NTP pyrophosphatase (MazG superfamily) [Clostridium beijerinckii]